LSEQGGAVTRETDLEGGVKRKQWKKGLKVLQLREEGAGQGGLRHNSNITDMDGAMESS
jgi:hypothetical protein